MKWKKVKDFLPIIYAAALIFIIILIIKNDISKLFSVQKVRFFVQSFGILSALVFILAMIFFSFFEIIPHILLAILGGFLFGALYGSFLTLTGIVLGSTLLFLAVRKYGHDKIVRLRKFKEFNKVQKMMKKDSIYAIYFAKLIPIFPNELLVIAASLADMKLRDFILIMIIGSLPLVVVSASLGDSFVVPSFSLVLIIFALVTSFLLSIFLFRKKIKKRI